MEMNHSRKTIKENKETSKGTAVVIGGGLVGALCVCILASRGYTVTMYEKRSDLRKSAFTRGRSINLALSHRGRKALKLIGLETEVLEGAIPMKGRLLHSKRGNTAAVLYDPVNKQNIYSVGRNYLNQVLLDAAEKYEGTTLLFSHKLQSVNLMENTITFNDITTNITVTADLIIGADGAFSCMRNYMQKQLLFSYSQKYIEHGYLELSIPTERGDKMEKNHLHIWPRGTFMMIALPNQDGSWTVTLFMPFEKFRSLTTQAELLTFFSDIFPDSLDLIGKKELVETYFSNEPSPLLSIKCSQFHMGDKFLIIGDAAHAMVPFYGQGMNAGFEDCAYLNKILDQTKDNIKDAIEIFTKTRKDDAHVICDLALYNYTEMCDLVTTRTFKIRKCIDNILLKLMPDTWMPLYHSVSFSHMRYRDCIENRHWQDWILKNVKFACFILLFMILIAIIWEYLSDAIFEQNISYESTVIKQCSLRNQ
ncbi:kynurenine 3-monooxygenase cn [Rhynchophorus ferrugineus]|uniref:kynurenine 3-monooxygenase cn n=1 Tax=Rhynchophorus ferrugineus TaxID=354439 RepID=UPI003FCD8BAE